MTDNLRARLIAAADLLRTLSADLDAEAGRIDARPQGYAEAYRLIALAQDLAAMAQQLEAVR